MLSIQGLASRTVRHFAVEHSPLMDAAAAIELEATMAHLWFEEIISGDRRESPDDAYRFLDRAEWYALAMLEGKESEEGSYVPLENPLLREEIGHVLRDLAKFREVTEERLRARVDSGAGTAIDQQYDAIFAELISHAEHVKTALKSTIDEELRIFYWSQRALFASCVALALVAGFVLFRYERNRLRDFTALREARIRAEESEEWLATTMRSMGDAMITTDAQGVVIYMNPVASALTGWPVTEAEGRPVTEVFDIVNEETDEAVDCPTTKVLKERKVVGLANHTVLIARDGTRRPIADSGAPIIDGEGNLLGVVLIFRDVTDKRASEREMERLRRYLQNVVDSMPSMLVGVDPEGRVNQWNLAAEKATGVPREEAGGRIFTELMPAYAHAMEKVKQALSDRVPQSEEKLETRTNGEVQYADMTVYPLVTNGIEGAVIRVDDVTERVRVEEMMVQTEKMMSVGGLAAGMAHEINNPLSGILQGVQNIVRRLSPEIGPNVDAAEEVGTDLQSINAYMEEREIHSFLDGIRESGIRASRIVSNMLQFSRRSESRMAPAELGSLIERTIDLAASDYDLKKKYDFRQIEIVREFEDGLPPVPCVRTEIEQVVLNLLKNAAQALAGVDESREKLRILIRTLQKDGWVIIEVVDNGPGMSEEVRRRAFEPFFTTKEVGIGTGLGLSVSYFIVTNNHGGTMDVTSAPGEGACFRIGLPLVREKA
jgi:PAS domain S-box-containing protein